MTDALAIKRYETSEGEWFYATSPTVGELLEALVAPSGAHAFLLVTSLLDKHVLFSRSSFDVLDVYHLDPATVTRLLNALLPGRSRQDEWLEASAEWIAMCQQEIEDARRDADRPSPLSQDPQRRLRFATALASKIAATRNESKR